MIGMFGDLIVLQEPQDVETVLGEADPLPGMIRRLAAIAHVFADGYRLQDGVARRKPTGQEVTQDFLFRIGVAMTCWFLEWTRTGKQVQTRNDRLRNDYVDAMLSVYGTYLNGLMTEGAKLGRLHVVNRGLLSAMGATLPPVYEAVSRPAPA